MCVDSSFVLIRQNGVGFCLMGLSKAEEVEVSFLLIGPKSLSIGCWGP